MDFVEVLISPRFGAGWSTWAGKEKDEKTLATDPKIIAKFKQLQESGLDIEEQKTMMKEFLKKVFGIDQYMGGYDDLKIVHVPKGVYFKIREFDGNERIEVFDSENWMIM